MIPDHWKDISSPEYKLGCLIEQTQWEADVIENRLSISRGTESYSWGVKTQDDYNRACNAAIQKIRKTQHRKADQPRLRFHSHGQHRPHHGRTFNNQ